jgi:hypothetical protein
VIFLGAKHDRREACRVEQLPERVARAREVVTDAPGGLPRVDAHEQDARVIEEDVARARHGETRQLGDRRQATGNRQRNVQRCERSTNVAAYPSDQSMSISIRF